MSDTVRLRDAAGNIAGHVELSLYDAHQINATVYAPDGDAVLLACDLSAATARKLAAALMEAAAAADKDKGAA